MCVCVVIPYVLFRTFPLVLANIVHDDMVGTTPTQQHTNSYAHATAHALRTHTRTLQTTYSRPRPFSAMVVGLDNLLVKPFVSVAPILGWYMTVHPATSAFGLPTLLTFLPVRLLLMW